MQRRYMVWDKVAQYDHIYPVVEYCSSSCICILTFNGKAFVSFTVSSDDDDIDDDDDDDDMDHG